MDCVEYVAQATNVSLVVAQIALEHTRGRVDIAIDYLRNETFRSRCAREAREYDRE